MNDMELAEEIERDEMVILALTVQPEIKAQIIAALRRGPGPQSLDARALVDAQAKDEGLWFEAQTAPEAYLQAALRKLHTAVERPPSTEMVMVPREPYWMIERGSPAEWWVRGMPEVWTTDASKAQRFNEWGAKTHAKELEAWGVKGPLRATEHLDCDGPLPAAEAEGSSK